LKIVSNRGLLKRSYIFY